MHRLSACHFCKAEPNDEGQGPIMTVEAAVDANSPDFVQLYELIYTVRCCNCGVNISDDDPVNLIMIWNGVGQRPDDECLSGECSPRLSPDGTFFIHKDECTFAKLHSLPTDSNPVKR